MFNPTIQAVIDEVDALRHKVDDTWQIPGDEALVLAQLARAARCTSFCEIGVSYGFSTLHLAAVAAEHAGHVHAIDIDPRKIAAATDHLTRAGLIDHVTLHEGDAREILRSLTPAAPFDFAFLDADKPQTQAYLEAVWPSLAPHAVIATDNVTSHPEQLAGFVEHLRSLDELTSCTVAVGNGFELSVRRARGA